MNKHIVKHIGVCFGLVWLGLVFGGPSKEETCVWTRIGRLCAWGDASHAPEIEIDDLWHARRHFATRLNPHRRSTIRREKFTRPQHRKMTGSANRRCSFNRSRPRIEQSSPTPEFMHQIGRGIL